MLGRIVNPKFLATSSVDAQLLVLRVGIGLTLFLKHGWEKVSMLSFVNPNFADPLHIGTTPSWIFATFADGICSLLIVLGFGTRWLSAVCLFNIFVAWALVHHFAYFGKTPGAAHGELMFEYLVAFAALLFGGPGRYSVDGTLAKNKTVTAAEANWLEIPA
jgi:putative oxidoreductase